MSAVEGAVGGFGSETEVEGEDKGDGIEGRGAGKGEEGGLMRL